MIAINERPGCFECLRSCNAILSPIGLTVALLLTSTSQIYAQATWSQAESDKYLNHILETSQAIEQVRVGECRNRDGHRPDEKQRIIWNDRFWISPDLRTGGHFAIITARGMPEYMESEFGPLLKETILPSSVEVGLDLLPGPRYANGKTRITCRLMASYRADRFKIENIGVNRGRLFGIFGGNFIATHASGPGADGDEGFAAISPEQLADRQLCQVLRRYRNNVPPSAAANFFSFPVDRNKADSIDDLFDRDHREIRRFYSHFEDITGINWLICCRPGAGKDSVTIRQCRISQIRNKEDTCWLFRQDSEVESSIRRIGDRHSIGAFSFTVAEIYADYAPCGWIHISNPELRIPSPDDGAKP